MREIKFRGKASNGEWHYGDLEHSPIGKFCRIHEYWDNGLYKSQYDVNPTTVGQFTGLQDNDGNDVYEGDIIEMAEHQPKAGMIGEVLWFKSVDEDYPEIDVFRVGWYVRSVDRIGGEYILLPSVIPYGKVIGNIHDNPELVEKGEH